jgi:hypothetical protein
MIAEMRSAARGNTYCTIYGPSAQNVFPQRWSDGAIGQRRADVAARSADGRVEMAVVLPFATATVVGGGYGVCRALAEHAAAVNGTAAGTVLDLCGAVSMAAAGLPDRGAAAVEALSGVSVDEWRKTVESSGRVLALELAAQAILTSVLLLVRRPRLEHSRRLGSFLLSLSSVAPNTDRASRLHFNRCRCRSFGVIWSCRACSAAGTGRRAVAWIPLSLAARLRSRRCAPRWLQSSRGCSTPG